MKRIAKTIILPFVYGFIEVVEYVRGFHTSRLLWYPERLSLNFGTYEIGTTRYLRKKIHGGVFFDIGANVGYYSRLMADRCEVYAFEPDPEMFEMLKRNCRKFPNIHVFNVALSDKDGTADFFHVKGSALRHSLIDEGNTEKYQVQTMTLDSFIEKNRVSTYNLTIKMDVEQAEALVFAGMQKTLLAKPFVIFESTGGLKEDCPAIAEDGTLTNDPEFWGTHRKVTNRVLI